MASPAFPPATSSELDGWELVWLRLETTGEGAGELAALRERAAALVNDRAGGVSLAEDPVVAAVRKLFRAAGTDPTRYRPSSEALARRVLKGKGVPAIHPLVDLNNLLSLELLLPCCVVDPSSLRPPFVLRAGRPGESMISLRGPFNLEGKPVLEDGEGPFGTPITDSERVRVDAGTREAWLVVYGVRGLAGEDEVARTLRRMLEEAPVARIVD